MKTSTKAVLGGHEITLNTKQEYRDETSREVRAANAATFLTENWETLTNIGFTLSTKKLRDLFIECVGDSIKSAKGTFLRMLPTRATETEERHGDDRATGDALGGHCLNLDMEVRSRVKGGKLRVIKLTPENCAKLEKFLRDLKGRKLDVIE